VNDLNIQTVITPEKFPQPSLFRYFIAYLLLLSGVITGCSTSPLSGDPVPRTGDEIVIAGQFIHSQTPVTLWTDPGGYDAYRLHRHFDPDRIAPRDAPERTARFGSFRLGLDPELHSQVRRAGWQLVDLAQVIDRVVLHFDACGTSSRCFYILHDIRGLSCHFLLDLDGTVYQTLDLKERAWHAGSANDTSVGIEIAHIGTSGTVEGADLWYIEGSDGIQVDPEKLVGESVEGFEARPTRAGIFSGTIHDRLYFQRDFTEAQYLALEKLLVTLCRVLPGIRPDAPRGPDGKVLEGMLPESDAPGDRPGIVGHWHVSEQKNDPGPAFDWDRIEEALEKAGVTDDS